MTVDQFKQKLKKSEKLQDILNYLVCIFFIGFGLWMIRDLVIHEFYHPEMGNKKYLILLFPFMFLIIGAYGFWRIPKEYQIGIIYSLKTIDEKWGVVNEYLSSLNVVDKRIENNHIEFIYRNKYLNSVIITLQLDSDKIFYNVRSAYIVEKGIIDLGLSNRGKKRIKKFLEDRL